MEDYEQAKVLIKVPLFGQNFQDDTLIIGKRKTWRDQFQAFLELAPLIMQKYNIKIEDYR